MKSKSWRLLLLLALPLATLAATPSAVERAQTLLQQGDYSAALAAVDGYLAGHPQDPQARFTRGLALAQLHRDAEAIKVFSDLTRDYPKLPEPYNNLAVLYARQGDYEKARQALEAALATHPSYATAAENLGDVYAALANAAYNRALALDKNNSQLRYKLALIQRLEQTPGAIVPSAASSSPAASASAAAPAVAATVAAAAVPAPAGLSAAQRQAVTATVEDWAKAWSAQDVDRYLAFYAADFDPGDGLNRQQWEQQRRQRLSAPKYIRVTVIDPQVTALDADHVRVRFLQDYRSDLLSDRVHKELELSDTGGSWKIVREVVR